MQKMFVIHYRMLVTFVKMIYAVNSKIISKAMVAILKFLSFKRLLFTCVKLSVFAVSMATAGILKFPSLKTIYSLFAENGVIVRNLNYRPWQWVYSISGCKSFPGGF